MEIWKDIKDFESIYKISNLGLCKRLDTNKILKQRNNRGYVQYALYKNNKVKYFSAHRLVAEAFLRRIKGKNIINHKNGIKSDNRLQNLEWSTHQENIKHSFDILGYKGSHLGKKGLKHPKSKTILQYNKDGTFIKEWGSIAEIVRELKIYNISNCCIGKQKYAGNFIWKYK